MSSKELVIELVRRLPDEASMLDIAHEIEFAAGVREAMDEMDRGEMVTAEDLLREIPQWAKTSRNIKQSLAGDLGATCAMR